MFDKQVDNARANLSMGNIASFAIPFPPLAEQHRIVAKVDELMALCDTLKSRLSSLQDTKIKLADVFTAKVAA
jgi:type I restriction enzyme S subunit